MPASDDNNTGTAIAAMRAAISTRGRRAAVTGEALDGDLTAQGPAVDVGELDRRRALHELERVHVGERLREPGMLEQRSRRQVPGEQAGGLLGRRCRLELGE